jgi:hypothetical protein
VFIWNMLSLNGMRHFGGKVNTKTMWTWPKVDNIISFRTGCYIWYQRHLVMPGHVVLVHCMM